MFCGGSHSFTPKYKPLCLISMAGNFCLPACWWPDWVDPNSWLYTEISWTWIRSPILVLTRPGVEQLRWRDVSNCAAYWWLKICSKLTFYVGDFDLRRSDPHYGSLASPVSIIWTTHCRLHCKFTPPTRTTQDCLVLSVMSTGFNTNQFIVVAGVVHIYTVSGKK